MIRDSAKKQFDVVLVWKLDRFARNRFDFAPEYRKDLVDIFINSIFLYDDKIVLTLNWKDGSKTVTLAELEDANQAVGEVAVVSVEADYVLQITDFAKSAGIACTIQSSHLDDNRPLKITGKYVR